MTAQSIVDHLDHGGGGRLGIAALDRIDNALVPRQHRLAVLRFDRRAEQERGAQRRLDDVADRTHEQIAGGVGDGQMQGKIAVGKTNGVGGLRPHSRHAPAEFGDVGLRAAASRERGGARLDGEPDLGEIVEKAPVDAGIEMPGQHVGVEHVPGAALAHHGADPRLGGEQPLRNQGLDALAQHRPRYAEHRREFGIARQAAAFGVTAGDDVDADAAGNLGVVGMRAPRRDDDKPGRHDLRTPALRGPARRAMPSMACCRPMKAKRRTPVTILVHQLDKVPSKLM